MCEQGRRVRSRGGGWRSGSAGRRRGAASSSSGGPPRLGPEPSGRPGRAGRGSASRRSSGRGLRAPGRHPPGVGESVASCRSSVGRRRSWRDRTPRAFAPRSPRRVIGLQPYVSAAGAVRAGARRPAVALQARERPPERAPEREPRNPAPRPADGPAQSGDLFLAVDQIPADRTALRVAQVAGPLDEEVPRQP